MKTPPRLRKIFDRQVPPPSVPKGTALPVVAPPALRVREPAGSAFVSGTGTITVSFGGKPALDVTVTGGEPSRSRLKQEAPPTLQRYFAIGSGVRGAVFLGVIYSPAVGGTLNPDQIMELGKYVLGTDLVANVIVYTGIKLRGSKVATLLSRLLAA
jgi:hypothetical protein